VSDQVDYYDLPGAPLARVYKNLLPNTNNIYKILKESSINSQSYTVFNQWLTWGNLGLTHPTRSIENHMNREEIDVIVEVNNAYKIAIDHYKKDHNISEDLRTEPDGPSFYKYDHTLKFPTGPFNPEFNMNYHTDFVFSLKDNPGKKPIISCTMYFNDDYDGGEVVFNIESRLSRPYYKRSEQFYDYESRISGDIVYAPKAGEILIFPSGNPEYLSNSGFYFHCVNRVMNGDKYFSSVFDSYIYEGSDEWKEGVSEYGEDLWIWLEKRRAASSGFRNKAVSL